MPVFSLFSQHNPLKMTFWAYANVSIVKSLSSNIATSGFTAGTAVGSWCFAVTLQVYTLMSHTSVFFKLASTFHSCNCIEGLTLVKKTKQILAIIYWEQISVLCNAFQKLWVLEVTPWWSELSQTKTDPRWDSASSGKFLFPKDWTQYACERGKFYFPVLKTFNNFT